MEPLDLNAHAPYKFRGSDFYVTMESKGGDSLMVEVEDRLTADQWRATFESSCEFSGVSIKGLSSQ